jgi:hypothetical protein
MKPSLAQGYANNESPSLAKANVARREHWWRKKVRMASSFWWAEKIDDLVADGVLKEICHDEC